MGKREKFIRCVRRLIKLKQANKVNPYAVCRESTGYRGTSHNIGLLKPKR